MSLDHDNHHHESEQQPINYDDEFDNTRIQAGRYIMIRLPSGNFRVVQLIAGQAINLGKFGTFKVDSILGHPFGFTYEISEKGQQLSIVSNDYEVDGHDTTDSNGTSTTIIEMAPHENNRDLQDDPTVQGLRMEDIEELKKQGLSGQEIIEKVKSSHASFEKKTSFSKEKYLKRKQQKFLQQFTPEPIGSSELIDIYLDKDGSKIRDMSVESLGLILSLANIRPGGRYLVVDDVSGVLVAGMMERMAGEGLIVVAHENEHPNLDALRYMNYSSELISKMIKTINWLEYLSPEEAESFEEKTAEELLLLKSSQRGQYFRRRQRYQDFIDIHKLISTSSFDGLVVATDLHLATLIPRLIPAIAGSRSIVIYNESKELLIETTHVFQRDLRVIAPTIMETRVRKYQTIPGRMHPHMTSRGGGGYILWGIRVLPNPSVNAVGKAPKKRKTTESRATDQSDVNID